MKRHGYLMIGGKGRLYAYGEAVRKYPEIGREHLGELLLDRHDFGMVPAIVRRQENKKDGFLDVGWSSWKRKDGVRIRVSLSIREADVEQIISPYEVFLRKERWPGQVSEDLMRLCLSGEKYRVDIGLIGAVGMEALTGLPYIDPDSDLDIIIRSRADSDLDGFSRSLGTGFKRRVDAELQFSGIGGVKFGDWMGKGQSVLVKSLDGAMLYEKKKLIRAENASLVG